VIAIPDTTGIVVCNLKRKDHDDDGMMKIARLFNVVEPSSPKPGNAGLRLLRLVSTFVNSNSRKKVTMAERMGENDDTSMTTTVVADGTSCSSVVERYFDAWNRRDVTYATSLFADDCVVYDMQYDTAFVGRAAVTKHLTNVGDCLPTHSTSSLMILSVRTLGAVWYGTLGMMVRHCHSPVGVPTTYSTRYHGSYTFGL
jgi:hypothetical protein